MDPFKNPFAPHAGTPPPQLAGRDAPLMDAELAIGRALAGHAPKGLMVTGLRGVGKTVLLNRFTEIAEQRRIEAIMLEAPEAGNFLATLARDLRRTVLRLERGGVVSETMRKALGVFKSFSLTFATDGTVSLGLKVEPERGYADSGDPELDLRDLFVALGEAARERDTALMLAIDELQYLSSEQFTAIIRAVHRTAQLKLPIIVCGAGLPNLPALAGEAKTYAERLFTFRKIGSLTPSEVRTAINEPAKQFDVSFSDAAVHEIIEVTKGYPYFVQEWAHDSWNIAKGPTIDLDDVQRATEDVHARLDEGFFRVRFDRLTEKEQQYLRAMAELGAGPHASGDISGVLSVAVTSVAPIREALIRKGMIYSPSHGEAAFSVPLFDRFMKRVIPELPKGTTTARTRTQRSR